MNKTHNQIIRGFKSAGKYIVELDIDNVTSKNNLFREVYDSEFASYRCSRALIVDIYDKITNQQVDHVRSDYDKKFVYIRGRYVYVLDYDTNMNNICTAGIHFYLSKVPAYYHNLISSDFSGEYKEWDPDGRPTKKTTYLHGKLHTVTYISYGNTWEEIKMSDFARSLGYEWNVLTKSFVG